VLGTQTPDLSFAESSSGESASPAIGGGDGAPASIDAVSGTIPDVSSPPPGDPGGGDGAPSASEQAYGGGARGTGDFEAQAVGLETFEGPDQPMGRPQNLEQGKQDLAAQAQGMPELDKADTAPGPAGAEPGMAGGDAGEMTPEIAASIGAAQGETKAAIAQAEGESNAFKAEMAARRDQFDGEQHATMLEQLKTMSPADKRSTLKEMGYDEKSVKKMKDAELDRIIEGKIDNQQRQSRILGMTPDELAQLPPARKIQHLVDLGIDKEDLDKAGEQKAVKLFDDVMRVAHVPGQHKVKIKIKGGLFGKSWIVNVDCDAEGNTSMTAQKEGGFFSKLWGWIKAALPIILMVLAPLTAGASLIVLAVYQAAVAISQGDWLGAIVAGAGALVGVGAFMAAKGALGASSAFAKIAQVAGKVKTVAQAAQTSMAAAKAKNAGSLLGALASGASAFAAFSANTADKFAQTMTKWSEKLKKWSGVISGGETVARGIKSGDPIAAVGGAFDTVGAAVDPKGANAKNMQRASTLTNLVNTGRTALKSSPPNYGAVAEAALGIASTLEKDRRLEDATRLVSAANRLKAAWDSKDPSKLADAAFGVAQAVQIAKYDAQHEQDEETEDDRTAYLKKYERAGRVVRAAGMALTAATTKPRPSYTMALAAGNELIAELTENKRIDEAAGITSALAAWTRAVSSKDENAIMIAGMAFGDAINGMRASILEDRAAAKRAAQAKLGAGETLAEDGGDTMPEGGESGSASDQAYGAPADKIGKDAKYKSKEWADRDFMQLDGEQRRMLEDYARESNPDGDGALLWAGLKPADRAGFLNITSVLKNNGFGITGLRLLPDGLQQDRLLFTSDSAGHLRNPLQSAIAEREARGDRGFTNDKPEEGLHPGMAEWGGRQWVTQNSMQIGGGPAGVFVDIDQYGVKVDVVGTFGHLFEVIRNKTTKKPTDPFEVAKGLDKRGDDP
jgi:hypothetical protein